MNGSSQATFVYTVCIQNSGYEASLELYKIYLTLPDEEAQRHSLVRVIDESGEDYLYPEAFFVPIEPSEELKRALLRAA